MPERAVHLADRRCTGAREVRQHVRLGLVDRRVREIGDVQADAMGGPVDMGNEPKRHECAGIIASAAAPMPRTDVRSRSSGRARHQLVERRRSGAERRRRVGQRVAPTPAVSAASNLSGLPGAPPRTLAGPPAAAARSRRARTATDSSQATRRCSRCPNAPGGIVPPSNPAISSSSVIRSQILRYRSEVRQPLRCLIPGGGMLSGRSGDSMAGELYRRARRSGGKIMFSPNLQTPDLLALL